MTPQPAGGDSLSIGPTVLLQPRLVLARSVLRHDLSLDWRTCLSVHQTGFSIRCHAMPLFGVQASSTAAFVLVLVPYFSAHDTLAFATVRSILGIAHYCVSPRAYIKIQEQRRHECGCKFHRRQGALQLI